MAFEVSKTLRVRRRENGISLAFFEDASRLFLA
jgi:hypothetical protein